MKIILKRDTSELTSRYLVTDDRGDLRYRIVGKRTPSGESAQIRDPMGETVCKIRGLGFSGLSIYSVSPPGGDVMRLNIAASAGRMAVRFRGISFCIRGDILMGSYDILDADTAVVCSVGKDFSTGCTQLCVFQQEREIFCIAAAACIDSQTVERLPAMQMS